VNQQITKSDYSAVFGNPSRHFRCDPGQLIQGLADDFELSFHRRTQQQIVL
jgi:hypothetical protein